MPPRSLVDPRGVPADRRRQHLGDRVADEVRAHEPGQPLADSARAEEKLPAPRHRQDARPHDPERPQNVAELRVGDHVRGLADVDLPEQVGGAEAGDDERPDNAKSPAAGHAPKRSCTRRSAAVASPMSASECAGESGSERISVPARSATGRGAWSGKRSRYQLSVCTGRKWMLVATFSAASARWYSSRVAPARSGSMRTT